MNNQKYAGYFASNLFGESCPLVNQNNFACRVALGNETIDTFKNEFVKTYDQLLKTDLAYHALLFANKELININDTQQTEYTESLLNAHEEIITEYKTKIEKLRKNSIK